MNIKELLEGITEGEWQVGLSGNANVVSFNGEDIKPIANVADKNAKLIAAAPTIARD